MPQILLWMHLRSTHWPTSRKGCPSGSVRRHCVCFSGQVRAVWKVPLAGATYAQMPHFMTAHEEENDEHGGEVVTDSDKKHAGADGEGGRGEVGTHASGRDARAGSGRGHRCISGTILLLPAEGATVMYPPQRRGTHDGNAAGTAHALKTHRVHAGRGTIRHCCA